MSPNGKPLPSFVQLRNQAWQISRLNPDLRRGHIYESIARTYGYRVYAAMHIEMMKEIA